MVAAEVAARGREAASAADVVPAGRGERGHDRDPPCLPAAASTAAEVAAEVGRTRSRRTRLRPTWSRHRSWRTRLEPRDWSRDLVCPRRRPRWTRSRPRRPRSRPRSGGQGRGGRGRGRGERPRADDIAAQAVSAVDGIGAEAASAARGGRGRGGGGRSWRTRSRPRRLWRTRSVPRPRPPEVASAATEVAAAAVSADDGPAVAARCRGATLAALVRPDWGGQALIPLAPDRVPSRGRRPAGPTLRRRGGEVVRSRVRLTNACASPRHAVRAPHRCPNCRKSSFGVMTTSGSLA